ncbi:hypothetical protein COCNU_scaffold036128G000010 [Cocos nucifera]|nr:hypothetical protein [Cocos nucifera]
MLNHAQLPFDIWSLVQQHQFLRILVSFFSASWEISAVTWPKIYLERFII